MNFIASTLGRFFPKHRTLAEWAKTCSLVVQAKPIQAKTKQNRASHIRRIVNRLGDRRIGSLRAHDFAASINEIAAKQPHLARRTLIEARDTLHEHLASNIGIYIPTPTADLLRRSVFVRLAQQHAFVRVEDQHIFTRVQ